ATLHGRCSYWRPLLPMTVLAGGIHGRGAAPCGLIAGGAYACKHHPRRRQPCPRAAAIAGGCPCKGLWPWPTTPIGGLAMAGRPSRGTWPWPATPFIAAFAVKMQQECVE
ncbi:hypothetical protein BHE74_00046985, partial [Ensete ventricosum]